jgi:peptidoglycan/xylan/chitin deacetylase (PgdA/CDA1 family)
MLLTLGIAAHLVLLLVLFDNPLRVPAACTYLLYHGALAWGVLYPRSRLFGPNRSRLDTNERIVALTFDDGPHPIVTPRVLDLLRARNVRATFFVIGRFVESNEPLVRRIVAEGHALGNHSYHHSYLFWAQSRARLTEDVEHAQRTIAAASGTPCRQFRAPVGLKSWLLRRVLERAGLELVSWNVRFLGRARRDPEQLARRLRRILLPGSIVLLHDGHDRQDEGDPYVLRQLPIVLDVLEELGYRTVTL